MAGGQIHLSSLKLRSIFQRLQKTKYFLKVKTSEPLENTGGKPLNIEGGRLISE